MTRRSPLAVLVLALLEEAPMHPYRMQQLIKERAQDTLVNVAQRNSVYQMLERLARESLVRAGGTSREPGRPERTVYEVTAEGTATLRRWLLEMLPEPAREFPEFPVALAFLPMLTPQETGQLLAQRIAALEDRATALDAQAPAGLPRLFLVEDEYRAVLLRAEIKWLRGLVADLEQGSLTWDRAFIEETLSRFG